MAGSKRVILIGLDGLGRGEIGEWIDDGTLSTLRSLTDEGTEAVLESTHPPWTPCAWPSLLSGRNPGEHGVFDFFTREAESYEKRLIDRTDVRAPYLWEVADACGRTSIAINYPVTHPASNLEQGAVVPGYLAPEEVEFSPPELRSGFEEEYGPYRIYPQYNAGDDAVAEYTTVARCRRDMARLLDSQYEWDLLAVQFQVTDSVFHDLDERETIRGILQQVDSYVGDIIALAEDATIFIASDHGMGDYDWTFYANAWLADRGYCETTTGDATYFREMKSELQGKETDGEATNGGIDLGRIMSSTADILATAGLPPDRIHRGLSAVGLAGAVERLLPEEALLAAQRRTIDWADSEAFQFYYNSLGITINLEGREPAGQVSREEYESLRDRLITELSRVTDPDGEQVFEAVKPREAVYEGEHVDMAPDVVLIPRDYRYDVSGSIASPFRRNLHKNHKSEGMLLSNVSLGIDSDLERASIYDVAPTVAACLGIPIDRETDGTALSSPTRDVETEAWNDIAASYRDSAEERSEGDVEQRLADLGYME